jgi:hypothetical protein
MGPFEIFFRAFWYLSRPFSIRERRSVHQQWRGTVRRYKN